MRARPPAANVPACCSLSARNSIEAQKSAATLPAKAIIHVIAWVIVISRCTRQHVSGATTAFSRLRFPVEPAGRARGVGCSRDGGCYAASGGAPASIPPQTRFARGEPGLKRPGGGCGPRPTRRRSSHSRIASWRRFARSRTRRRSRSGVGRDRVPGSSHHRDALPAPGYFDSGARRKRSPAATRALRARPRRRRGGLEARPRRRDPPCPCPGTR